MKKLYIILILIIFFTIMGMSNSVRSDDSFTPWSFQKSASHRLGVSQQQQPLIRNPSVPAHLLKNAINFFIHYISRVDGDRCHMYPSCSSYSLQAVEKHGFIIGAMLTADRLIHESNEMDYAPLIERGGTVLYLDSVSNNDFWWNTR
jgi:hypothetical protein